MVVRRNTGCSANELTEKEPLELDSAVAEWHSIASSPSVGGITCNIADGGTPEYVGRRPLTCNPPPPTSAALSTGRRRRRVTPEVNEYNPSGGFACILCEEVTNCLRRNEYNPIIQCLKTGNTSSSSNSLLRWWYAGIRAAQVMEKEQLEHNPSGGQLQTGNSTSSFSIPSVSADELKEETRICPRILGEEATNYLRRNDHRGSARILCEEVNEYNPIIPCHSSCSNSLLRWWYAETRAAQMTEKQPLCQ